LIFFNTFISFFKQALRDVEAVSISLVQACQKAGLPVPAEVPRSYQEVVRRGTEDGSEMSDGDNTEDEEGSHTQEDGRPLDVFLSRKTLKGCRSLAKRLNTLKDWDSREFLKKRIEAARQAAAGALAIPPPLPTYVPGMFTQRSLNVT
jgi:hypothetical protein